VTPLIDVALVLLILFMVLTPLSLKELPVEVPRRVEVSEPVVPQNQILVRFEKDGTLYLDAEVVSPPVLAERLKRALAAHPDKVVFFRIDDDANYGQAVGLMDLARGAGAKTLG